MTTLVGTQNSFSDAVKALMELDYDAIEAYEAAINRLENQNFINKMEEFKRDHERHVRDLTALIRDHDETPPEGPSMKQWITKGKVVVAELLGDKAILEAMHSNELDTNTAYDRLFGRTDLWENARETLRKGVEDERRHKQWLESTIRNFTHTKTENLREEEIE